MKDKEDLLSLPKGWILLKFKDICNFIGGNQPPKSDFIYESKPGYIRLIQIRDYKSDKHLTFIPEEKATRICFETDVMIGRYGPPIFQILRGIKGAYNVALIKAQPVDIRLLNNDFLYYLLNNPVLRNHVIFNSTRTAGQDGVRKELIEEYPVPLPPLNEQHRIVTKIEALKTRSARVKDSLSTIPALLDQFRQSVLAAAFRGDLTAEWREQNRDVEPVKKFLIKSNQEDFSILHDTWELATVGDVIESLKYGTSQKCGYELVGVPVLRIPNIGNGVIEHFDLKYADLSKKEFDELKLVPGDILIIRSNGSASLVGKSALVKESEKDFAYAGYLIRLRLNQLLIYPNYLNLCFSSHDIRLQIEVPAKSTSGVHNINSQEVKRLKIPVAPLLEQKEIVRQIQRLFKIADTIAQQYQQTKGEIEQLDQSILSQAFSGNLVPQDPNDEPASELLNRIRTERDKTTTTKTKTKVKKSEPFKEAIQMKLDLE